MVQVARTGGSLTEIADGAYKDDVAGARTGRALHPARYLLTAPTICYIRGPPPVPLAGTRRASLCLD